jgi:hypothetical protein
MWQRLRASAFLHLVLLLVIFQALLELTYPMLLFLLLVPILGLPKYLQDVKVRVWGFLVWPVAAR